MVTRHSINDSHVNPGRVKKFWGRILLALLILIASAVLIFLTLSRYFAVDEVQLPNIVGLSSEEAVSVLAELELEPVLFTEDIANAIVNAVTSQSPEAGTIVRRGRSVAVGVNRPDVRINIPSLIDITQTNAQEMLANLGLELDQIDFAFSDAEKGRVIAQEPAAGTVSSDKIGVSIVVSRGPELATFRMPEVRGLTIEQAKQRLQDLGLRKVESVAGAISLENPNIVTAQVPQPGSMVTAGSHVVLNFALSNQTVTQVPSLVGVPLSQIQTQLSTAGLSLGQVTYINDPAQPAGIVTYAPSGFTVRGVAVEVTLNQTNLTEPITNLSIAPQPTESQIELEGLVPQVETTVVSEGAGFVPVPEITTNPSETVDTLEQVTQETPSNELIDQGPSLVFSETTDSGDTATESVELEAGGRDVPFNFDPASLGVASLQEQAYRFKLVIVDEQGERTALERQMSPGEPVQIDLTVFGEATLQTYINDILFQAWNP